MFSLLTCFSKSERGSSFLQHKLEASLLKGFSRFFPQEREEQKSYNKMNNDLRTGCRFCGEQFLRAGDLAFHFVDKHLCIADEEQFRCYLCNASVVGYVDVHFTAAHPRLCVFCFYYEASHPGLHNNCTLLMDNAVMLRLRHNLMREVDALLARRQQL